MGEIGGMLLMIVAMSGGYTLVGFGRPASSALGLALMVITAFCVIARHADGVGHSAMRKASRERGPSPEEIDLLRGLGIAEGADAETIRRHCHRIARDIHAGRLADVDLDDVFRRRDAILAMRAASKERVSDAQLLDIWRREAGRMGRFWGWLLPSDRLLKLQRSTGESLAPGRTGRLEAGRTV
jgi:hypothetical protein